MKYYICSFCSCFARLPDPTVFKCRYCGSEKGRELTEREYMGWAK
jgi:ribosomal protein L40E